MDIRYGKKNKRKIERLIKKHGLPKEAEAVYEEPLAEPVVGVQHEGQYIDWTRGIKNVASFIEHRAVHIREYCPLVRGRCKGLKCQFYVVSGGTGDCSLKWSGIAAARQVVGR